MKKNTKRQVIAKLNKMLKEFQKKMEAEAEKILKDADMWYGLDPDMYGKKGKPNEADRNGDQFVLDGVLELDKMNNVRHWLHTREEVAEALNEGEAF